MTTQHRSHASEWDLHPGPRKTAPVTAPGLYVDPGDSTLYKVVRSNAGRPYAKRLVIRGRRAHWSYASGAIARIDESWALTVEQAARFGRTTGLCAVCLKPLSNPASIAAGIGPVCRRTLRQLANHL